jgi:hypothetical protein
MLLRRRALRCIRIRINWILLVVAGRSVLSFYVSYSTFEGKKGFPPIYSTERYRPSFPPVSVR